MISTAPGRKNRLVELAREIVGAGHPVIAVEDTDRSCQRNHWRCLEMGLRVGSGYFAILEDDVIPAPGAIDYVARWPYEKFPSLLLTAWFDQLYGADAPYTLHTRDCRDFLYSQAVTYSTMAARQCLRSPLVEKHDHPHNGDGLVSRILAGQRYGIHVPNLFQHTGTLSLTLPGRGTPISATFPPEPEFHASHLGDRVWQSALRRMGRAVSGEISGP